MKKNLLFIVMMLGVSLCCIANEVLSESSDVNTHDYAVQAGNGFEVSSVTVLYNKESYGINSWYGNMINCVFTPEVYGKRLEFRIYGKQWIGEIGDVLRFDPSVLISGVEFMGNSAPYGGIQMFIDIPPVTSGSTNFGASLTVYRGVEVVASVYIQIRIDTVGPPAGGNK